MKNRLYITTRALLVTGLLIGIFILSACSSSPTTSTPPAVSTTPPASNSPTQTITPTPTIQNTLIPAYTVNVTTKAGIGNYLVDGRGMTLYHFMNDTVGKSNATAAILANWPIFNPTGFVLGSPLSLDDFGTITRDDGQMQATFRGYPLYYYIKDQAPSDTLGQGIGGIWFVIDPANFPPSATVTPPSTSTAAAATSTPTTTTTPALTPSTTATSTTPAPAGGSRPG